MPSLNIAYRPIDLESVIGNKDNITSLQLMLARESELIPHSFLLSGEAGCGKTTIGRIVARMLGAYDPDRASNPDFREYNSSNTRGIDTIREIEADAKYAPLSSPCIVYLMDEVHQATKDAQNALLKILEEPPRHVYFILCTTDPEKLLPTVRSRCVKFEVRTLLYDEVMLLLNQVIASEIEEGQFPKEVLVKIATECRGVPREALTLLEKVIDIDNPQEAMNIIEQTVVGEVTIRDICQVLMSSYSPDDKWVRMKDLLKNVKDSRGEYDFEKMRIAIISYLDKVAMNSEKGSPMHYTKMIMALDKPLGYPREGLFHNYIRIACWI
jgi:DNA polymerase III subunit gamma/tau